IYDFSAKPFLSELAEAIEHDRARLGRRTHLIAESDLNDARIILPRERNGYQLDAQWSDDFHHAVHTLLTGESTGYYVSFGNIEQLATCFRDGWCYSGQYSPARKRPHGNSADQCSAKQFVVCSQNHDQIGNRMLGERLITLTDFASAKLAAATVILSPFVPLLFMGEEYGETAPFLYFTSHGDENLVQAVREGRKAEFAEFARHAEPPDPQSRATFEQSR